MRWPRSFAKPPSATRHWGLNESELAFYDALANNESAVRDLGDEVLKKIAFELTEKLRGPAPVWIGRSGKALRARLRNLAPYLLPTKTRIRPTSKEEAIRLVLEQAERLSDEWMK